MAGPPSLETGPAVFRRVRPFHKTARTSEVGHLERAEKIDEVLLLLRTQPIETVDSLGCFAAWALVRFDRRDQVALSLIHISEPTRPY